MGRGGLAGIKRYLGRVISFADDALVLVSFCFLSAFICFCLLLSALVL